MKKSSSKKNKTQYYYLGEGSGVISPVKEVHLGNLKPRIIIASYGGEEKSSEEF